MVSVADYTDTVSFCKMGILQTTPCYIDRGSRIGVICAIVLAGLYFVVIWGLLYYKLKWYKKMPYVAVNKGIIYNTLQVCSCMKHSGNKVALKIHQHRKPRAM